MATIIKRTWYSRGPTGHKVRRVAYGYTLQLNGKQERKVDAGWTKEQAQEALAAPAPVTFGAAVARYLAAKSRKRSIADDARHLKAFAAYFGTDTLWHRAPGAASVRFWEVERNRFAVKGGESSRLEVKDPVSASVPYL